MIISCLFFFGWLYLRICTGITQNVDDLLQSHTARTTVANSEFIVMLNQASTDRVELGKYVALVFYY